MPLPRAAGLALAGLLLALPARADDKEDIVASIESALQLVIAGDFDTFLAKHVDPARLAGPKAVENWKAYSLRRAQTTGKACLVDGHVKVDHWRGDPAAEDRVTVYLSCGEGMPKPSSHRKVDGEWKITSVSW